MPLTTVLTLGRVRPELRGIPTGVEEPGPGRHVAEPTQAGVALGLHVACSFAEVPSIPLLLGC